MCLGLCGTGGFMAAGACIPPHSHETGSRKQQETESKLKLRGPGSPPPPLLWQCFYNFDCFHIKFFFKKMITFKQSSLKQETENKYEQ